MDSNTQAQQRLAMIFSHVKEVDHDKLIDSFPFMNSHERIKYSNDFQKTPSKKCMNENITPNTSALKFPLSDSVIPAASMAPNPCLYNRYNYSISKLVPVKNRGSYNGANVFKLISNITESKELPLVVNFNDALIQEDVFVVNVTEGYDINGLVALLEEEYFADIFITADELDKSVADTVQVIKELNSQTRVILICGETNVSGVVVNADYEQDSLAKHGDIPIDMILADNTLVIKEPQENHSFAIA